MRRHRFTVIELLVLISIIAICAGMVMGMVGNHRKVAQLIKENQEKMEVQIYSGTHLVVSYRCMSFKKKDSSVKFLDKEGKILGEMDLKPEDRILVVYPKEASKND